MRVVLRARGQECTVFQVQANGLPAGQGAVGDRERRPIKACCESRFEGRATMFEDREGRLNGCGVV